MGVWVGGRWVRALCAGRSKSLFSCTACGKSNTPQQRSNTHSHYPSLPPSPQPLPPNKSLPDQQCAQAEASQGRGARRPQVADAVNEGVARHRRRRLGSAEGVLGRPLLEPAGQVRNLHAGGVRTRRGDVRFDGACSNLCSIEHVAQGAARASFVKTSGNASKFVRNSNRTSKKSSTCVR